MNDTSPEDEFDAAYDTSERHARYASLLMLIILIFVFWFSITSIGDLSTSSDTTIYQEDGIIENIGRFDDRYFAIVTFEHDRETFHKSITISYSQFVSYKEGQPVKIRIEGSSYSIMQ